jgi:hypothetical protein
MLMAACLSACTDSDIQHDMVITDGTTPTASADDSNIPIRFAPLVLDATVEETATTRGSINDEALQFDNLGVFCLAKYSIEGMSATHTPSWSNLRDNDANKYSLWKNNVKTSVYLDENNQCRIAWGDGKKEADEQYYPANKWFAYGFVIYHPWTPYISYDYKKITAYIKVDGNDDVRYAMADGPNMTTTGDAELDKKAFSASFYQGLDTEPNVEQFIYPRFKLQLLMSRLNFSFRLKEESARKIRVEKVEIDDFPCIMKLDLASRSSGTLKTGYSVTHIPFVRNDQLLREDSVLDGLVNKKKVYKKLTEKFPALNSAFGRFVLREQNDEPISGQLDDDGNYKYELTTTYKPVGDCILIPPVYKSHSRSTLKIYVTLADEAGNTYVNSSPLQIPAPAAGWVMGKKYPINIAINPPLLSGNEGVIAEWDIEQSPIVAEGDSHGWKVVE